MGLGANFSLSFSEKRVEGPHHCALVENLPWRVRLEGSRHLIVLGHQAPRLAGRVPCGQTGAHTAPAADRNDVWLSFASRPWATTGGGEVLFTSGWVFDVLGFRVKISVMRLGVHASLLALSNHLLQR